jgi:glycosyltransferase involved in cell wall biosynthesis
MISVIVPVYKEAQTLAACLQALQNQTRPPDEIIVVDDGSNDWNGGYSGPIWGQIPGSS